MFSQKKNPVTAFLPLSPQAQQQETYNESFPNFNLTKIPKCLSCKKKKKKGQTYTVVFADSST